MHACSCHKEAEKLTRSVRQQWHLWALLPALRMSGHGGAHLLVRPCCHDDMRASLPPHPNPLATCTARHHPGRRLRRCYMCLATKHVALRCRAVWSGRTTNRVPLKKSSCDFTAATWCLSKTPVRLLQTRKPVSSHTPAAPCRRSARPPCAAVRPCPTRQNRHRRRRRRPALQRAGGG